MCENRIPNPKGDKCKVKAAACGRQICCKVCSQDDCPARCEG